MIRLFEGHVVDGKRRRQSRVETRGGGSNPMQRRFEDKQGFPVVRLRATSAAIANSRPSSKVGDEGTPRDMGRHTVLREQGSVEENVQAAAGDRGESGENVTWFQCPIRYQDDENIICRC